MLRKRKKQQKIVDGTNTEVNQQQVDKSGHKSLNSLIYSPTYHSTIQRNRKKLILNYCDHQINAQKQLSEHHMV